MHPDFEKYKASTAEDREQFNVRLPRELVARLKVLATLEGDTVPNLMTEAIARLVEARASEPMASSDSVQRRIDELRSEIAILNDIQPEQANEKDNSTT